MPVEVSDSSKARLPRPRTAGSLRQKLAEAGQGTPRTPTRRKYSNGVLNYLYEWDAVRPDVRVLEETIKRYTGVLSTIERAEKAGHQSGLGRVASVMPPEAFRAALSIAIPRSKEVRSAVVKCFLDNREMRVVTDRSGKTVPAPKKLDLDLVTKLHKCVPDEIKSVVGILRELGDLVVREGGGKAGGMVGFTATIDMMLTNAMADLFWAKQKQSLALARPERGGASGEASMEPESRLDEAIRVFEDENLPPTTAVSPLTPKSPFRRHPNVPRPQPSSPPRTRKDPVESPPRLSSEGGSGTTGADSTHPRPPPTDAPKPRRDAPVEEERGAAAVRSIHDEMAEALLKQTFSGMGPVQEDENSSGSPKRAPGPRTDETDAGSGTDAPWRAGGDASEGEARSKENVGGGVQIMCDAEGQTVSGMAGASEPGARPETRRGKRSRNRGVLQRLCEGDADTTKQSQGNGAESPGDRAAEPRDEERAPEPLLSPTPSDAMEAAKARETAFIRSELARLSAAIRKEVEARTEGLEEVIRRQAMEVEDLQQEYVHQNLAGTGVLAEFMAKQGRLKDAHNRELACVRLPHDSTIRALKAEEVEIRHRLQRLDPIAHADLPPAEDTGGEPSPQDTFEEATDDVSQARKAYSPGPKSPSGVRPTSAPSYRFGPRRRPESAGATAQEGPTASSQEQRSPRRPVQSPSTPPTHASHSPSGDEKVFPRRRVNLSDTMRAQASASGAHSSSRAEARQREEADISKRWNWTSYTESGPKSPGARKGGDRKEYSVHSTGPQARRPVTSHFSASNFTPPSWRSTTRGDPDLSASTAPASSRADAGPTAPPKWAPPVERSSHATLVAQIRVKKPWIKAAWLQARTEEALRGIFSLDEDAPEGSMIDREAEQIRKAEASLRRPAASKTDAELTEEARYFGLNTDELRSRFAARNHYERLGLQQDASTAQIKKGFMRLALVWHPDTIRKSQRVLFANERGFEQLIGDVFHMVDEAYKTLSDNGSRYLYDNKIRRGR